MYLTCKFNKYFCFLSSSRRGRETCFTSKLCFLTCHLLEPLIICVELLACLSFEFYVQKFCLNSVYIFLSLLEILGNARMNSMDDILIYSFSVIKTGMLLISASWQNSFLMHNHILKWIIKYQISAYSVEMFNQILGF